MHDATGSSPHTDPPINVCLIGAGTVGRAILDEHLKHRVDAMLIDANADALQVACDAAAQTFRDLRIAPVAPLIREMPTAQLSFGDHVAPPSMVIESIPENLALKQSLFVDLRRACGVDVILASNTSNLRIASVFELLPDDPRCCGMHFFMPVAQRPLVECVPTSSTSQPTQMACQSHATRIDKQTLHVQDSPGFVVNRLLAAYLNQSLLMLEHGIDASLLAEAASLFGMPMSPLELIDTIGLRTAFDSGRVFWQSFPNRIDPAPILAGMIKLAGKSKVGPTDETSNHERGDIATRAVHFCDTRASNGKAHDKHRPLSESAKKVIATYQRDKRSWSKEEVMEMISVPMWIEAAEVIASAIVSDEASIELAMQGGLGFFRKDGFFDFFDSLGRTVIQQHLETTSVQFRALRAPAELVACLRNGDTPGDAVSRYAFMKRGQRP